MRAAARWAVTGLLACVVLGVVALSAPAASATPVAHHAAVVHHQQQTTTAPPGPALEPAQTEADQRLAKRKLIIGLVAAGLLVIVVFGRRARMKRNADGVS